MTDTLEIFGTEYTGVTGIKATDDNSQTKTYIRPQGTKSISTNGTGIDVTEYASVNVAVPTGITPTGNINITSSGSTDVTNYATATVPAVQLKGMLTPTVQSHTISVDANGEITAEVVIYDEETPVYQNGFATTSDTVEMYNQSGQAYQLDTQAAKTVTPTTSPQTAVAAGKYTIGDVTVAAMPTGTAGTPTAIKGTVSNHAVTVTPSVTNTTGYITGDTKTGTGVSVSASELVSGTYSVTSSGTKDVTDYASASVPSGTEGTPTATKGAVSNHSVSVTPSVTNTTGFITGSTKTGTAVTVSASELVSGSETKTANGTYDVTNLAELVVNVSGGGSSGTQVATKTATPSTSSSSIQFVGLLGEPTSFVVLSDADLSTGASPYKTASVVFDGDVLFGQEITNTSNAQVSYVNSGWSKTYSNGTLTITGTGTNFQANQYTLMYSYGGSASNIGTEDVQVGSGATSITFTGLESEPTAWSCVFKSNFSTSNGYQRAIAVVNDGNDIYGMAMDSAARAASNWSATYNNGSLTITSQGTNAGGYFHQPGYYQLTYITGEASPYQKKTVTPTTSQQIVEPDSGYDALSQVTVNAIPSEYIIPTGNLPITANSQSINVAQYATVSVNVPSSGSSKNAQTVQSTTRASSTSYTKVCGDITVAKTGTYDVYWSCFRSSTSGTWGSQLYIDDEAHGSAQTSFTNNISNVHLTNVSLTANEKVSVYARSRGSNYYAYVGTLTIIEK